MIKDIKNKFFKVKITNLPNGSIMISILDISKKILLDKENERSNLLSIINATVSHDMRNPLNSILAMN